MAVALATAAAYFFSIFDLAFLSQGNLWRLGHGDVGQTFVGFLYFVRDHWRFPLFHTPNLGYPYGTNIIFTDSIPLCALVSKIFRPILPNEFHPFGLWIFLCYLLLAHAFSALLFHFGYRSLMAGVASALFAVLTPFFTVLLAAPALSGHFLIVYALLLYFQAAESPKPQRAFALFTLLLVVALWTHVYLFAMVLAIYGCALVNAALPPNRSWRDLGISATAAGAAVAATILASGHLSTSVPWTASSGFGTFSMNLLAPITPVRPRPDGALFYMKLSLEPDATGGQHAGFNYWGAGILVLLCITAPSWLRDARRALFRRPLWPLVLGFLFLTLFALSNRVYFGQHLILSYDLPKPLLLLGNQFRSSGRFFWAVSYAVMALAISRGLSLRPRWLAAALIIGALGVQLADDWPLRASLRRVTRTAEPQFLTEGRWRPIVAEHEMVALVPPAQCGGFPDLYAEIGRMAAGSGVALHSVSSGRYGIAAPASCRALYQEVLERGFRPGVLYLVDHATLWSLRQRPELPNDCSVLEGQTLCTLERSRLHLAPLPPDRGPAVWPSQAKLLHALELADFFGAGWSTVEQHGVWSLGSQSQLLFRLSSCAEATSLRVRILPFVGPEGQIVTASANQGAPVTRAYSERNINDLVIPISSCDPVDPRVIVTFRIDRPLSPLELGESGDTRPLGILLVAAELLP